MGATSVVPSHFCNVHRHTRRRVPRLRVRRRGGLRLALQSCVPDVPTHAVMMVALVSGNVTRTRSTEHVMNMGVVRTKTTDCVGGLARLRRRDRLPVL